MGGNRKGRPKAPPSSCGLDSRKSHRSHRRRHDDAEGKPETQTTEVVPAGSRQNTAIFIAPVAGTVTLSLCTGHATRVVCATRKLQVLISDDADAWTVDLFVSFLSFGIFQGVPIDD